MQLFNICIADPFNKKHIEMFKQFEKENQLQDAFSASLEKTANIYDKTEYSNIEKESNTVNQIAFIEFNDIIKSCCYIRAEKDVKLCEISFPNFNNGQRKKELLDEVMQYAFDMLGMETVCISVEKNDKNFKSILEYNGFENLDEVNGKIMFLKEKEIINEIGSKIA